MKLHNLTVCDQVRVEENGKFLLIGVYSNSIIFQQLPAQIPLSLWMLIEHEELGSSSIHFRGRMPDIDVTLFEASIDTQVENTEDWSPLGIAVPVLIGQPGKMVIEAKLNDDSWFELRTIHLRRGPVSQLLRGPVPAN